MDSFKKLAKKIFQYEAKLVLKKYKPKIVAITGSVGKTMTREAIYLVLSKKFFVRKSEKSFTAGLGVPLAIIGCEQGISSILQYLKNVIIGLKPLIFNVHYPEWLILEIDADKPGDLLEISSVISPNILVMTAIGDVPSHVELFSNVEDFIAEKKKYVKSLNKDCVIIYNADDQKVLDILQDVYLKKISCCVGGYSDVKGSDFSILYENNKPDSTPIGMSFEIKQGMEVQNIKILGSISVANEYAILLAYAIGVNFGLGKKRIDDSLKGYKALPGRMKLISGINESIIIDDSYNSSPIAMKQAIDVLGRLNCVGKKIAVIGDMFELGKYSATEHKKLGQLIKDISSNVICVGLRSVRISEELLSLGFKKSKILSVDTVEEAYLGLQKLLKAGDIVLIKGSQSMRMEKIVEKVMKNPEEKSKVLVRQEPEWLSRT